MMFDFSKILGVKERAGESTRQRCVHDVTENSPPSRMLQERQGAARVTLSSRNHTLSVQLRETSRSSHVELVTEFQLSEWNGVRGGGWVYWVYLEYLNIVHDR